MPLSIALVTALMFTSILYE